MTALYSICDEHGHDEGLPDRELRQHVLATAIRAADACLTEHGYADPNRSLEVLHVAFKDGLDVAVDESR